MGVKSWAQQAAAGLLVRDHILSTFLAGFWVTRKKCSLAILKSRTPQNGLEIPSHRTTFTLGKTRLPCGPCGVGPPDHHSEVPRHLVGVQQSVRCFCVRCPALLVGRPQLHSSYIPDVETGDGAFLLPEGPHISNLVFSAHAN